MNLVKKKLKILVPIYFYMNIKISTFILLLMLLISCSQESTSENESSKNNSDNSGDVISNIEEINSFFEINNGNNIVGEVLYENSQDFIWQITKNTDYGNINLFRDGNQIKIAYVPNQINIVDNFKLNIQILDKVLVEKELNFLIQVGTPDTNTDDENNIPNQNPEPSSPNDFILSNINRVNNSSFNQLIIDFEESFSYSIVKNTCTGVAFLNKSGNKLYLSYSPSSTFIGSELLKIKIVQNGIETIYDFYINIKGSSQPQEVCETDPELPPEDDPIIDTPSESYSWFNNFNINNQGSYQFKIFETTFSEFYSYEILESNCSGNISLSKINNSLFVNYTSENNESQKITIRIRQRRTGKPDLVLDQEILITYNNNENYNLSCIDNNPPIENPDDNNLPPEEETNPTLEPNKFFFDEEINIDSWDTIYKKIFISSYPSTFAYQVLENPCKGLFSISKSNNELFLSYDSIDYFYGTQSFKVKFFYQDENNIDQEFLIDYKINIKAQSSVDNSCRENDSSNNGSGGVIDNSGSNGSDGEEADGCIIDCEGTGGFVDLGFNTTLNTFRDLDQNILYNSSFNLSNAPGQINITIVEAPKKGILTINNDYTFSYQPYTNHVGNDTVLLNFETTYNQSFGGNQEYTFNIIADTSGNANPTAIGFTQESRFMNLLDINDSQSEILLNNNLLIGLNTGNDFFFNIPVNNLVCPNNNENFYALKIFGNSSSNLETISLSSLWNCTDNISYLNTEKIIFYNGDSGLLFQDDSIYLIQKNINSISNYVNKSLNQFILNLTDSSYTSSNELLISQLNGFYYLKIGNNRFSEIKINNTLFTLENIYDNNLNIIQTGNIGFGNILNNKIIIKLIKDENASINKINILSL